MSARQEAKKAQGSPPRREAPAKVPFWLVLLLGGAVLAAALIPNWKSLGYDFVWDDPYVIGPHLDVKGWPDVAKLWNTPFDLLLKDEGFQRTYFRPATLFSLAFDRATSGENPRGFHAQNLFWYAAACLFLWLLAWEISGRPIAATAGTILFALHPTHPESVCFISGRTDLIAGASLFASLWAAARFGPRIRSPWRKLLPAALLLLPGLFAKEVALFGALLLPLALWLRDPQIRLGALARTSAAVAAAALLYLGMRAAALGPTPLPTLSPVQGAVPQLLTSVAAVARYVVLLIAPVTLTARHEIVETHAPDAVFLAGLLALIAIGAGAWILARRRSMWLLPLAIFAATLLPVCWVRILSGAIVAERFLFVPSAAIALAVALAPRRGDAGPFFLLASAAAALWLFTLLQPRVAIWKDEGTLFGSMLRESPNSPHVHGIIGGYYYRRRDLERAAYHYRRSYELYPRSGEMLLNLVAAEDELGRTDSAFVHVRKLNALYPEYGAGWYALGNIYARVYQPDSARIAYEQAIRLMPGFAQAENNLGAVLEQLGRFNEALAHYRRAEQILPGYPDAARNRSRLTATLQAKSDSAARR
ncbi:MAG: tetratricopeptide repeat protein [Candidatus Eisenbacteria bacterium]|uniref:Tetratricopeptide repeat protein n=1 Tax=Eiseniibacteriota bacterium TaxID=2212470 RepID=A0A538TU96_UNCEI|nr:MAG: tetratricopeptide repeat protein [Candidatus Eisenbacteria bacterium]